MVRNNPIYSVADNKEKIKEVAQARPHSYFRKSKPKTPHRKARLQMQARTCSPTHQQSQSVGFSPFGSSATPFVCLLPLKGIL